MPSLDWIIEAFGHNRLDNANEYSLELFCKNMMESFDYYVQAPPDSSRLTEIKRAIEVIELSLIEAFKSDDRERIKDYSLTAFKLYRISELPKNPVEKLKLMIKISCFGILGEKTVDVRRWLKDIEIPSTMNEKSTWAKKVFFGTGVAFLLNVRKNGWDDLEKSSEIIKELRKSQREYEQGYLKNDVELPHLAALELVALYHLAKAMDLFSMFIRTGYKPRKTYNDINFHLDKSFEAVSSAGIAELGLIITWIRLATQSMIKNSIWWILTAINHNITKFVKHLASKEAEKPLFELWPSQSKALLEEGLLDPAKRAVVIVMPTSGGKTLLAEFRILQTKQLYPDSWIAYIVPTRALVNQITIKLREDLSPLGIKIESAVPAFELDPTEEELLNEEDSFDVLITTQEKLDLLIRGEKLDSNNKPLGLVIVDEAHNIKNGERGLRTELLLATINREYQDVQFLLLSPFVPNIEELANWLDSERSAKISIRWKPNEQLVGMFYPEGRGRDWNLDLKPIYTSQPTIAIKEHLIFNRPNLINKTKSSLTKLEISSIMASILSVRKGVIVIARRKDHVSDIAKNVFALLPEKEITYETNLVKKYIATEFGKDYLLYSLLNKGVAFHHAGVSVEMRYLLEWLMRKGDLKVMVATTTLAQGVNFPISSVVLNDFKTGIPPKKMPIDEFWNIAGRAGRADQETLGIIALTSKTKENPEIEGYVKQGVSDLMSYLEKIMTEALQSGDKLNFSLLARNNPEWSNFVQYLCHAYRQIGSHSKFIAETETLIKATFGYQRIAKKNPSLAHSIIEATVDYAQHIRKIDPQILYLVDQTGFSPDSIRDLRKDTKKLIFDIEDWSASGLFSTTSRYLKDIVGSLLNVPELDFTTARGKMEGSSLADILTKWVNGEPISNMAEMAVFMDDDRDKTKAITSCTEALTNIINYASWGMGALEGLTLKKEEVERLDKRTQLEIQAIPAMIYFGVNTIEGVVMRNLGVPRSIANSLGEKFKQESGEELPSIIKIRNWLRETDDRVWDRCIPPNSKLSGEGYRSIWRIINGEKR